jgi:membrane-associated protease RseP (regulator of RpoE activity)
MDESPAENRDEEPIIATLIDEQKSEVPAEAKESDDDEETPRRRRLRLPVILFLLTCCSTFFVGATRFVPQHYLGQGFTSFTEFDLMPVRRVMVRNWQSGLLYTALVLGILLAHEMGHFIATVRYRIAASYPMFIPFPFNPFGTMGAIISMNGMAADRKQMFDIGIAGPLAGLVVAIPILLYGVMTLDFTQHGQSWILNNPWGVQLLLNWFHPTGFEKQTAVYISQVNPYYLAGWFGLLITSLNLMPVSQLDGGHIFYTMFLRKAWWIARGFIVLAIAFVVAVPAAQMWTLMIFLVLLMGADHPPTRDDSVKLGWFRWCLGMTTVFLPILCFAPVPIMIPG